MTPYELMKTAHAVQGVFLAILAIGFFRFWARTRFWLPRYAHVLAGGALVLGLGMLAMIPPDAPINQGDGGWWKKGAMVIVFPAIVYFFFVFYGGQHAAYERERRARGAWPRCGAPADPASGEPCSRCGRPSGSP